MYAPLRDTELVNAAVETQRRVRDANREAYDGLTENGPGPFMVLLPGRTADHVADFYDEMDPLPWADTCEDIHLDPDDPVVTHLVEQADRYTDGALLVESDGRIHPYTVELEPDVRLEDRYEEGWGTKTRAALNMSGVALPARYARDLDAIRRFEPDLDEHVDAPVNGRVWTEKSGEYGDVISVATSAKTGQVNVFDRGRRVAVSRPVEPSRDLDDVWQVVRDRAADRGGPDADATPLTVAEQYDSPVRDRLRIEDIVETDDRAVFPSWRAGDATHGEAAED